jgi:glyceraldehyde 3-phosphate dehydrogenase
MTRAAINGLGRIGRATLKILVDEPGWELVAINDLVPAENLAYLLKYDTVYGRYKRPVKAAEGRLTVDEKAYKTLAEKDPAKLPWADLGVEVVFECTGVFRKRQDLEKHLDAGAQSVFLSAPAKSDDIQTVVHGVNELPKPVPQILSCASCTTNCIAPVVEVMGRRIGIKKAAMTTIHAYTASQALVDGPHKKMRRGRAGAVNLVPTSTGAALATTKTLPQYKGLFDGVAVRAPVPVGSVADLVFLTERPTTADEVNNAFREEAGTERYRGILGITEDPLVSADIIADPRASVVDLAMTQVVDGDLVKVMSWYDNEWGYANQMVKLAAAARRTAR